MNKISARMVLHSANPNTGKELMTMSLIYPRFVHSEFMTHRVFSRNAMSSRAVPVQKMIDQVRNDPAMPIHWGSNQPGMQAGDEITNIARAKVRWYLAAQAAADNADIMNSLGLHKQVVNRILEPFQWMRTIVSATEWDNFFELRCTDAAEPNMRALADAMAECIGVSQAVPTEFHMPYLSNAELRQYSVEELMMVSAARCARVSYLNHDGSKPDIAKDLELAARLKDSKHASPFEHQAIADEFDRPSRNFIGWTQFRASLGL